MATVIIENQIYSQALRGQNAKVTVDPFTYSSEFSQLKVGQICTIGGVESGFIYSVDSYGNSFEICPLQPNFSLSTNSSGYLQQVEITVTL